MKKVTMPDITVVTGNVVPFRTEVVDVKNKHQFQFAVDYGNEHGPWVAVTLNDSQYRVGYLPTVKTGE